jgi:hypothetical protein
MADEEDVDKLTSALNELDLNKRKNVFLLQKQKCNLEDLLEVLGGTKRYIHRDRRNLLIHALKFCRQHSLLIDGLDHDKIIDILRESTINPLQSEVRSTLREQLAKLMDYFGALETITPQNDDERFYIMLEARFLFGKYSQELLKIGIVCVEGLTRHGLKLQGTLPAVDFYSRVTSLWQFDEPSKYFLYLQVSPAIELPHESFVMSAGSPRKNLSENKDSAVALLLREILSVYYAN